MAVQTLPLFPGLANFKYTVVLDSISYIFEFQYMDRSESWYIDILTVDETPIRTGIRLVNGWPLNLRDAANEALFNGILYVIRLDDKTNAPDQSDMDAGNFSLLYLTDEDADFASEVANNVVNIEVVP